MPTLVSTQVPASASPVRMSCNGARSGEVADGALGAPGGEGEASGAGISFLAAMTAAFKAGDGGETRSTAGDAGQEADPEPKAASSQMEAQSPSAPLFGASDFLRHGARVVQMEMNAGPKQPTGQSVDENLRPNGPARKGREVPKSAEMPADGFQATAGDCPSSQSALPDASRSALVLAVPEMSSSDKGGTMGGADASNGVHPRPLPVSELSRVPPDGGASGALVPHRPPALEATGAQQTLRAPDASPGAGGRATADPPAGLAVVSSDRVSPMTGLEAGSTAAIGAMAMPPVADRAHEVTQASATLPASASASLYPQIAPVLVSLAGGPAGTEQLTVRLDPAELGLVEIRIDRAPNAPPAVSITADRPETLLLLQRDQHQLHWALDQAGIPVEGRQVTFQPGPPDPDGAGLFPDARNATDQPQPAQSFGAGSDAGGFDRGQFRQDGRHAGANSMPVDSNAGGAGTEGVGPLNVGSRWQRAGVNIMA